MFSANQQPHPLIADANQACQDAAPGDGYDPGPNILSENTRASFTSPTHSLGDCTMYAVQVKKNGRRSDRFVSVQ